ncbi:hypothetical protein ECDEC5E_1097 [Escherichia coli DEC5E]|nr:hypothetical protein ECDEC5E_1097 [Escherichia coli DEC5E]
MSVNINDVRSMSGKTPEFVDVICFVYFITIVYVKSFFKFIPKWAKPGFRK